MAKNYVIVSAVAGAILLVGVGLVLIGSRPPPERTFKGAVKDLLPKPEEIPGWTVEYQPIADTPEMKAKVTELLNYDDAVYAVYTNGSQRLSVYIAYWAPGKMSHRLVAGHTPDVCWVGAGWTKEDARSGVLLADGKGGMIQPAEMRVMSLNGHREYVVFWHLLDGRVVSYGTGWRPPWHAFWDDIWAMGIKQRQEQFFLRISSNLPLAESWETECVRLLLERFPIGRILH